LPKYETIREFNNSIGFLRTRVAVGYGFVDIDSPRAHVKIRDDGLCKSEYFAMYIYRESIGLEFIEKCCFAVCGGNEI